MLNMACDFRQPVYRFYTIFAIFSHDPVSRLHFSIVKNVPIDVSAHEQ